MIHLPWIQIFIGDELAETSHLSPEEYGAHMLLRLHQWQHGELPSDDERLRRICRFDTERWPAVRDILAPMFGWVWHHERTAETRKSSEEKHANLSRNGRLGGRPRKNEKADGKPTESQAYDRHKAEYKAEYKADGKQSPSPSPSQSPLHPRSTSAAPSEDLALEKERKDTETRASLTRPYPKPRTPDEGKQFLMAKGAPSDHAEVDKCLRMLMAGHLTPYDIEHWNASGRASDEEAA